MSVSYQEDAYTQEVYAVTRCLPDNIAILFGFNFQMFSDLSVGNWELRKTGTWNIWHGAPKLELIGFKDLIGSP